MKSSGLVIAAVVLAALSGVLYWSNRHPAEAEKSKPAGETPPKLLTIADSDVSKIEIKKNDAVEVVVTKDSSGRWQLSAPQSLAADQAAVSELLSSLSSASSDRLIEEKASDLKLYGLARPRLVVTVTDKQNKAKKLLFGDDTPTGASVYVNVANDPRIFTVASYTKTSLDKSPKDLREKRLLTLDSDKISRVELLAKKQDIEFGRDKDEWQILKPSPMRADRSQIEDLLRKLTDAKMDLSGSDADAGKAASTFASGAPIAIAKVTAASGTQQLQVRKSGADYYAKSSIVDGAYKISSDLAQELDKSVDDFRNKKLFDFGFEDPDKIEIHDSAKTLILSRKAQDWFSDGKKMDASSVQTLVGDMRDLSAIKFPRSVPGPVLIDITVTSKDGKRAEKVSISKSAAAYFAKRENDTTLYELDSKAVEDVQKAAGNVKPISASGK